MKESVLDVLIYLLEEYEDEQDIDIERELLTRELLTAGFDNSCIGKAWGWLDDLAIQVDSPDQILSSGSNSLRILSEYEQQQLSFSAQRYLALLQGSDLIDAITFELILDRLIALDCEAEELEMEQIRWVVLMVSFNRVKDTRHFLALETLIFSDLDTQQH